jgi:hypothetical protein
MIVRLQQSGTLIYKKQGTRNKEQETRNKKQGCLSLTNSTATMVGRFQRAISD